jgi:hypothetical protein
MSASGSHVRKNVCKAVPEGTTDTNPRSTRLHLPTPPPTVSGLAEEGGPDHEEWDYLRDPCLTPLRSVQIIWMAKEPSSGNVGADHGIGFDTTTATTC